MSTDPLLIGLNIKHNILPQLEQKGSSMTLIFFHLYLLVLPQLPSMFLVISKTYHFFKTKVGLYLALVRIFLVIGGALTIHKDDSYFSQIFWNIEPSHCNATKFEICDCLRKVHVLLLL